MDKNTKMILGVGAVAIVGYLVYKQMSKPKASFANLTASGSMLGCPCKKVVGTHTDTNGNKYNDCAGGQSCKQTTLTTAEGGLF